jgi:FkbM family methyltransferase
MKSIARKLKLLAKASLGKELLLKSEVIVGKERFGSVYGGWDIVVADLNSETVVYSFGVGEDISFDTALIKKFGLTIHAFDPTPKSIEWVKRQGLPRKFVMHSYGIASFDGDISFNPPENPDHVSHTILDRPSTRAKSIIVPVKRISTIMQELGHDHIHIIKMDIEGAEYDVIEDIYNSGIRPEQLLVEFHHRFPGVGIQKTKEAINRIRSMGYRLFCVSDTKKEYCFIRRLI